MKKNLMWALGLIVLTAVLLIFNSGRMELRILPSFSIQALKPVVFLCMTGIGVAIGLLLK